MKNLLKWSLMLVLLCLTVNVLAQSRRGNTNGYRQGNTYNQRRGATTGESILSRLQKQAREAQEDATRQSTEKRNKNKTKNSTNNQQQEMETVVTSSNNVATADHPQSQTHEKEKDDVVLVVSGEGQNKEEATKNALRSAIEQAFGTFVSANTEILNDKLIKDEIATVASGNIKTYKEIATTILPNGLCSVTLSATVSTGKLVSYVQAHGGSAEFAGQTFMMEMKMRELNKENEIKAIEHLISLVKESKDLFDYKVTLQTPTASALRYCYHHSNEYGDFTREESPGYLLPAEVLINPNKNYNALIENIQATLSSLSLTKSEVDQYRETNTKYYTYNLKYFSFSNIINEKVIGDRNEFFFRSAICSKLSDAVENHIIRNAKNFSISLDGLDTSLDFSGNILFEAKFNDFWWYDPSSKNVYEFISDLQVNPNRNVFPWFILKDRKNTRLFKVKEKFGSYDIAFPFDKNNRGDQILKETFFLVFVWMINYEPSRYLPDCLCSGSESGLYLLKNNAERGCYTKYSIFLSGDEISRLKGATITPNTRDDLAIAPTSNSSSSPKAEATIPSLQPAHTYSSEEIQRIKDNAVAYRLAAQAPSFNGGDINDLLSWVHKQIPYAIAKEYRGTHYLQLWISEEGYVADVKFTQNPIADETVAESIRKLFMAYKPIEPAKNDNGTNISVFYNSIPLVLKVL